MGRSLRGRFSGVVRYTDELVRALAPRLGTDLTVFVTQAEDNLDGLPVHRVRAPFPTPNEYARTFWEQSLVPIAAHRRRIELYHSPNYILPIGLRCPSVVTIHDLAFLDPTVHRLRSQLYLRTMTALAVRQATRVICVSNHTRDQVVLRFPHASEKTRVIGEGVNPSFRPQPPEVVERFRSLVGLFDPYVLFVGTVEPRKNLDRLIRAFEVAVKESGAPHHLVIAGGWGWKAKPVLEAFERSSLRERIHFLGYLSEDLLPAAYSGADVFAYPSLYEGFGLPPLEAMTCGTPVLTSTGSALAEVVGDAAVSVDPLDETALARELASLLTSPARRRQLAARGLKRAACFRWENVAEQTLAVYREALS